MPGGWCCVPVAQAICAFQFSTQGKSELKAATAVNVRHILCEKQSRALEALEKIQVRIRCTCSRYSHSDTYHRAASRSTRSRKSTPKIKPRVRCIIQGMEK